ncbi:MAG: hypothetical protein ABI992_00345 [Chthoniobacterales bacterium]
MKTRTTRNSGSSLIIVLSVLATLMVIVAVAAEYTNNVGRNVQRSGTLQSAVAVGDSCLEMLFANWRSICSAPGVVNLAQTTGAFSGIPLPTAAQLNLPNSATFAKAGTNFDPNVDEYYPNYTISNYKVVAVDPEWQTLASASTAPKPALGQLTGAISSVDPTTAVVYNYIASADVTLPALGPNGRVVAKVRRVFQKQQLSPWNFAIFFLDPLEIHPGPNFVVTGWVHTNSDLYTGHSTLSFADKVTYSSDWFVDFMPGETTHAGETPAAPSYLSNLPPARDQALQPFGLDSTSIFSTADTNPNNDSYRELIEQAVAGNTDPLAGQRYYDQAAIKVLIDGTGASATAKIYKADGTEVKNSSSDPYDKKLYTAIASALNATTGSTTTLPTASIQDNREAASVRLVDLDIGRIVNSLNASSGSSNYIDSSLWNGIVYIADRSATSSVHRGIRVKNGAILPTTGLTVASANPVYIQGNYNTGTGTIPSNATSNNDPTIPQAASYKRKPASVVADAVNILSNSWNDANAESGDPLSARVATNTTVNTAIIAGNVPSSAVGGDGRYSGGAENFPRFLEDWSGIKFTYYGSMVQLYKSQQAIGKWGSANVYGAPTRQWYFDTNFRTSPPPGSIMLYSYIKGKWSTL